MAVAVATAKAQRWPAVELRTIRLADTPDSDGFHRSWVMLLPEGKFTHPQWDELDFTKPVLDELKRNFDEGARGIELALDYDHKASEGDSKAPGWIEGVEYRPAQGDTPAGLWGRIRWTRLGLADVKDQIYRYISAEVKPNYRNDISGKTYKIALIGATLTNRPFMKQMPAIALAEVSTRPWGDVDKAKLPDSCFLDPTARRLPIYEGAGAIGADGRYTKRGKLNINGVRAALAAVHGAHTGKPMTGLPAGTAARLERLAAKYSTDGSDGNGGDDASTKASEVMGGGGRMGKSAKTATSSDNVTLEDLEAELAERQTFASTSAKADDTMDSMSPTDDGGDAGDGYDDSGDDGDGADGEDGFDTQSDTHGAMTTDGHTHGKYAEHAHDGEGDHSEAPLKGTKKMSAKKMSEVRSLSEARQIMIEQERRLRELERANYTAQVTATLSGWDAGSYQFVESKVKNPASGEKRERRVQVALSRVARQQIERFLLSDTAFEMEQELRERICRLFEVAATGAVDLSVRGSSHDMEAPERQTKTLRKSASGSGRLRQGTEEWDLRLAEEAEQIAASKGETLAELRLLSGRKGDREAAKKLQTYYELAAARMSE